MIVKPDACRLRGCPWAGDMMGFVPDRIPDGATVLFLMQNPGRNEEEGRRVIGYEQGHEITEECVPQPMIGPTGNEWSKTFLPIAGLDTADVGVANVLRCRKQLPSGERTNTMPDDNETDAAVAHCATAHWRLPESVKVIVAQGAHAWRFVGGPQPLDLWRGHTLPPENGSTQAFGPDWVPFAPRPQVLATVHIADLRHRPKLNLVTRKDFLKIHDLIEGTWPRPFPNIINANTCSYDTLAEWFTKALASPYIVIDTEYDPKTLDLVLFGISMAPREEKDQPCIQYHWFEGASQGGRRIDFLYWVRETVRSVPAVFQNVLADLPVLRRNCNLDWSDFKRIEDTMQAHAVLWCELPHSFEFMASVDGKFPKVKHLFRDNMDLYNQGDLLDTGSLWEARLAEFQRDPLSRKVYDQQMLLLPHLDRAMEVGIAVDTEKVPPAIEKYRARVEAGRDMAQAYVGWPMNLNSDEQLKVWLYEIEGMPVVKHPETKEITTNADAVSAMRNRYMLFDARDDEENMSAEYIARRVEQGAHPLLEAYVLYARAEHILGHYLLPLVEEQ